MSRKRSDAGGGSTHAAWCARASILLPQLGDEEACELRIAMLSGPTRRLAALVRRCSADAHWSLPDAGEAEASGSDTSAVAEASGPADHPSLAANAKGS